MEKSGIKKSIANVVIFAIISVLVITYLYFLDDFLGKNYWWIFIVGVYLVYFIFQNINFKRKKSKEFAVLK